jgi:hypothetical protein
MMGVFAELERSMIRVSEAPEHSAMNMNMNETEIGDMKMNLNDNRHPAEYEYSSESGLSERDKCELVWEYALSLGFKDDVVFNRVDGGCEIFIEIEDEDEDDEETA